MTPIRVLLADDHPLVRCGIAKLLDTTTGIDVVGEVSDGVAALQQTIALQPDVLVLDVEMPGLRGDEVARRIRAMNLPVRILILSVYHNEQQISELLASGVDGYVAKHEAIQTIVEAIRGVVEQQGSWLSPWAASATRDAARHPHPQLTERELAVLNLVTIGKTDPEIAGRFGISERTVRYHLHNIYRKLGVSRRCEVVVWAMREGFGSPPQTEQQYRLAEAG
jgi:DNA-binding NarL/FixJ family response regulator